MQRRLIRKMSEGDKYILKNGEEVVAISLGRLSIRPGDKQPNGRLTMCDRVIAPLGRPKIVCKCDCGKFTVVSVQSFKRETTKSCGCFSKELHIKLGQQLGKLPKYGKDYTKTINPYYIFVSQTKKQDEHGSYYWKIRCKRCNKEYEVIPSQLISDFRRRGNNPCDCWKRISKGVIRIQQLLDTNKIDYIQEYKFKDCVSPKGNSLKFDFYLPDYNIAIEYDGEQHFFPITFGGKESGEQRLKKSQEYDNIKDIYCKDNNIKLIRISYIKYPTLCLEDIFEEKGVNSEQ